jgi:arginyl-tRNA synthetase
MIVNNLKKRLTEDILKLVAEYKEKDKISESDVLGFNVANITIGQPKNKRFGDLTTNAAMVLAPALKDNPIRIAEMLKEKIFLKWKEIQNCSIVSPGFINFSLSKNFIYKELSEIANQNEKYGFNERGKKIKIQIEFVSANPTGNLHIGHGRWAALGDSLSNIYSANGFNVSREYYVNDYGSQIKKFALCIRCLYLRHFRMDVPYPEDGYPEEIVKTVVAEIIDRYGDKFLVGTGLNETVINFNKDLQEQSIDSKQSIDVNLDTIGNEGMRVMLDKISNTLKSISVEFDKWFCESSLYESSNFEKKVKKLMDKGIIYQKDDALWFKSFEFGDDKDRVVIRTGGEPTYFASDILYLLNKIDRGFDRLIYILGADHHGYVKRLHAIGKAVGYDDEKINVIIGQLVRLVKKGEIVKMSKRKGKVYNLDDLIREVGKDSVRYFFTTSSFDTPLDFDIGLAKQKSNKNPVYYVQYAHARIASVIGKIKELYPKGQLLVDEKELNLSSLMQFQNSRKTNSRESLKNIFDSLISQVNFNNFSLDNTEEFELAKILIFYPDIIYDACSNNAPYLVNQFLYRLASQFHYFYNHYRVIDEGKLDTDRFKLILLARIVLVNAFKMLNITAPLKM